MKRLWVDSCAAKVRFLTFLWAFLFLYAPLGAENLRIAYHSITAVCSQFWCKHDAGIFEKHNIAPELVYFAGDAVASSLASVFIDSICHQ